MGLACLLAGAIQDLTFDRSDNDIRETASKQVGHIRRSKERYLAAAVLEMTSPPYYSQHGSSKHTGLDVCTETMSAPTSQVDTERTFDPMKSSPFQSLHVQRQTMRYLDSMASPMVSVQSIAIIKMTKAGSVRATTRCYCSSLRNMA